MSHEQRNTLIDGFVNTSLKLQTEVGFNIGVCFSYTFTKTVDTHKISTELFGDDSGDVLDHLGDKVLGLKVSIEDGRGLLYLYTRGFVPIPSK